MMKQALRSTRATGFVLAFMIVFGGMASIGVVLGRIDDNRRELRVLRGEIPRDYITASSLEPLGRHVADRDAAIEVCRVRTDALREAIKSLILVNAASFNTAPGMAWESWPSMPNPKGP